MVQLHKGKESKENKREQTNQGLKIAVLKMLLLDLRCKGWPWEKCLTELGNELERRTHTGVLTACV